MKDSKKFSQLFAISLICLVAFSSCRKEEEKHEGYYVGTERHTQRDSGQTGFNIDTTFAQELDITYDKNMYTMNKILNGPHDVYGFHRDNIENGQYVGFQCGGYYTTEGDFVGGTGSLRFVGDSVYFGSTTIWNWDVEEWMFSGKRN